MSVDKRFTLGDSENKSLQSLDIDRVNDTGDLAEIAGIGSEGCLSKQLLLLAALDIAWLPAHLLEAPFNAWKHLLGGPHYLEAVHEIRERLLSFLQLSTLGLDESLLLRDLPLDLFEEQIESLLLLGADVLQLLQEAIDVFRRVDLDPVLLALLMQKVEEPLRVLAGLDLLRVRQVVWRLLAVQINEMGESNITKLAHHALCVVLGDGELVQVHRFRSRNKEEMRRSMEAILLT